MVEPIKTIHLVEEGRPIETMFDVTVAATAHARSIPNTDKRLEIEREAGQLLQAASPKPPHGNPLCGGSALEDHAPRTAQCLTS